MKKNLLKLNLPLFFLFLAGNIYANQVKNAELFARLVQELGPDRAREFIYRLEQRQAKKQDPKIITPIKTVPKPPVIEVPVEPVTPTPVTPQPPAPQAGILSEDREQFFDTIANLQLYTMQIYDCVKSFLNKNNHEPYRSHVNCFKNQLRFIQNHIQNHPISKTSAAQKIFDALYKTAKALEKSQDLMVHTLDRDYVNMSLGAMTLGGAMKQLETPVNQQRTIINQQIGILRNELRKLNAQDMLEALNKFNTMINETFNYGSGKPMTEVLSILIHRVKR